MRVKLPTPDTVVLCLLAALVVGGLLLGGGSSSSDGAGSGVPDVGLIARRVEQIRGLQFKRLPRPLIVTPSQASADQLAAIDRETRPGERQVTERLLVLLGLVPAGTDLRDVAGDVSTEQVAGYYDPSSKRLAVVSGHASSGAVGEITLAHELDHALDDQALGLRMDSSVAADDSASAYTALEEGTATVVMTDYARRFISSSQLFGSALSAQSSTAGIPPYVLASLLFSYVEGETFVSRLRAVAHGWKLVNYAFRTRPPRSTEQVIHPDKYLVDEKPVPVPIRDVRALVPASWHRLTRGTLGEFDTHQLLKRAVSDAVAGDAAAGWGGGSYAMWGDRSHSAVVLSWAWDTPLDAAQFRRAASVWARKRGAVLRASGLRTVVVLAPGVPRRAGALAAAALRRR